MTLNEFLIKAHESLDAATVEDGIGQNAMCMYHLVRLHGLLIKFIETKEPEKNEPAKSDRW